MVLPIFTPSEEDPLTSIIQRLALVSVRTVSHRELLARHVRDWDELLALSEPGYDSTQTQVAGVDSGRNEIGIGIDDVASPSVLGFPELDLLLELILEYAGFFVDFMSVRRLASSYNYASVSAVFAGCCRRLVHLRTQQQRQRALELWPALPDLQLRYGEPEVFYPFPFWRQYRIEVWWYFDGHRYEGTGWHLHTSHYVHRLSEIERVWQQSFRTGGYYTHVQLYVSMWTYDIVDGEWCEEDHV